MFIVKRSPVATAWPYDKPSIPPHDRGSSKAWYEGREEGRPLTPPPMHVTYASSRARIVNRTKSMWIDAKTGRVGEKTIRFEKSPSEDNSPRQMPRYSRS
ncbi:unnamed protein product, partial [Hymenolepis diminuta]